MRPACGRDYRFHGLAKRAAAEGRMESLRNRNCPACESYWRAIDRHPNAETLMLKPSTALIALLAAVSLESAAAQAPRVRTAPITPRAIALAPANPGAPPLTVSSSDFVSMGTLDRKFMQAVAGGENKSPAIAWTRGPAGTQSYVLFAEG